MSITAAAITYSSIAWLEPKTFGDYCGIIAVTVFANIVIWNTPFSITEDFNRGVQLVLSGAGRLSRWAIQKIRPKAA
ncbi:hypothetical protein G6L68_25470 [Agrobacterium fabrum]|nr:hypothetical protein [Agrobacterium fabrum]